MEEWRKETVLGSSLSVLPDSLSFFYATSSSPFELSEHHFPQEFNQVSQRLSLAYTPPIPPFTPFCLLSPLVSGLERVGKP